MNEWRTVRNEVDARLETRRMRMKYAGGRVRRGGQTALRGDRSFVRGKYMPEPTLHFSGMPYDLDDFVLFFSKPRDPDPSGGVDLWGHPFDQLEQMAKPGNGDSKPANQMDITITFHGCSPEWVARGLACKCYAGECWSVAVRKIQKDPPSPFQPYEEPVLVGTDKDVGFALAAGTRCWPDVDSKGKVNDNAFSLAEIVNVLYALIFEGDGEKQGLVMITGSTGSAKSQITRGLLHRHIEALKARNPPSAAPPLPRPHIVTVERPLESYYLDHKTSPQWAKDPKQIQKYGIDWTARLFGSDTDAVEDALVDALRQKPSAVYLDEVRRAKEWKPVLRFAGSGHLIFSTAHAGSLTEALGWILKSADATTPALRGEIGHRIRGLIHLSRQSVEVAVRPGTSMSLKFLSPALWRTNHEGVSNLVADGLASVLPTNPGQIAPADLNKMAASSLGRRWFARYLLANSAAAAIPKRQEGLKSAASAVLCTAYDLDLKGQ